MGRSKGREAKNHARAYRVLDANLNRAREGLRVLEDTARFIWDSPGLFRTLRGMRHRLDEVTRAAYPRLLDGRESALDRGRTLQESAKRNFSGLVAANFRRAQEALRVLEEYGKVVSPGASAGFKKIRFDLYAAEKDAVRKFLEN